MSDLGRASTPLPDHQKRPDLDELNSQDSWTSSDAECPFCDDYNICKVCGDCNDCQNCTKCKEGRNQDDSQDYRKWDECKNYKEFLRHIDETPIFYLPGDVTTIYKRTEELIARIRLLELGKEQ